MDQRDAHTASRHVHPVCDSHRHPFSNADTNPDIDHDLDGNVYCHLDLDLDPDSNSNPDIDTHAHPVRIPYFNPNSDTDSDPDFHPHSKPYGTFRNGDGNPWKRPQCDRHRSSDSALLVPHTDCDARCPHEHRPARL